MSIKSTDCDSAINAAIEQSHIVFKPQYEFVHSKALPLSVSMSLLPMYRHDIAQWLVAGKPADSKPIHVNATTEKYIALMDSIKSHPRYDRLMSVYDSDWWLYEKLADTYPQIGEYEND